ncbi:MAG: hypothetical protein M3Z13_05030 [Candidatus Dormibacteraeota bacterium]|nr:hypothetical protein [Candidatus Dormibacteraeota bacterium]
MTSRVTPLTLMERDRETRAGGERFVPEPGDRVQYVDLDGYAILVWFARRDALRCPCGGRRVQEAQA